MIKKKAAAIAALCTALAFGALAPASAAAPATAKTPAVATAEVTHELPATGAAAADVPGECTGSWVTVHAGTELWARSTPDATSTTNKMWPISGDKAYPCRKLVIGGRHNACGKYDANGWIVIQDYAGKYNGLPGWSGYIPSVCTTDGV